MRAFYCVNFEFWGKWCEHVEWTVNEEIYKEANDKFIDDTNKTNNNSILATYTNKPKLKTDKIMVSCNIEVSFKEMAPIKPGIVLFSRNCT